MTRLRGVLLLCALALVRARWVLVFWPNFDVSMPSCAVDGVSGLELSYDELACGHELSASCYPPTCTDACKDDADCEFVVAKTNALTGGGVCEFRCKEHLLEDYDMVPRLGYTTFQLTNEEEIIAMDLDINDVTFLNSSLSPGHTLLIVLAACALVGSVVVSLCTRTARTCTLPEPLQSYVEEGRSRYGAMLGFGPDGSFIGFGTAASSPSRSSRFLSMFGFGTAAPSPPPSYAAAPKTHQPFRVRTPRGPHADLRTPTHSQDGSSGLLQPLGRRAQGYTRRLQPLGRRAGASCDPGEEQEGTGVCPRSRGAAVRRRLAKQGLHPYGERLHLQQHLREEGLGLARPGRQLLVLSAREPDPWDGGGPGSCNLRAASWRAARFRASYRGASTLRRLDLHEACVQHRAASGIVWHDLAHAGSCAGSGRRRSVCCACAPRCVRRV